MALRRLMQLYSPHLRRSPRLVKKKSIEGDLKSAYERLWNLSSWCFHEPVLLNITSKRLSLFDRSEEQEFQDLLQMSGGIYRLVTLVSCRISFSVHKHSKKGYINYIKTWSSCPSLALVAVINHSLVQFCDSHHGRSKDWSNQGALTWFYWWTTTQPSVRLADTPPLPQGSQIQRREALRRRQPWIDKDLLRFRIRNGLSSAQFWLLHWRLPWTEGCISGRRV